MFETHLIQGRRKVHGRQIVFDITLSGLQVGTDDPLQSLTAIKRYLRAEELRTILDFGAGRLRNTKALASSPDLEVWFTEFSAIHCHELEREHIKNARALAGRFKQPDDRPSEYLREKLCERTRTLIEKLDPHESPSKILVGLMLEDLNPVLRQDMSFYAGGGFAKMSLPQEFGPLVAAKPAANTTKLLRLNRYLMEVAYPRYIAKSSRSHIYPHELPTEPGKFDAILLSYVLHILPHSENRDEVLEVCRDKLDKKGLLVVASPRYNSPIHQTIVPGDEYNIGWVRGIKRPYQTFYSEPSQKELIKMVERCGFKHPTDPEPLRWQQATAHVLGFTRS